MQANEQQSILTIALLAAFADGHKADTEREAIRRLAETLGHESGGAGLARLYQDVLLKRVSLADAVAGLKGPGQRQLAYEMAVCVCDADGSQSAAEQQFLADLSRQLGLEQDAGLRDFRDVARFRAALGTKVSLDRNQDGTGKLVVHFYNDDDLESIYRLIAGEEHD